MGRREPVVLVMTMASMFKRVMSQGQDTITTIIFILLEYDIIKCVLRMTNACLTSLLFRRVICEILTEI